MTLFDAIVSQVFGFGHTEIEEMFILLILVFIWDSILTLIGDIVKAGGIR